MAKLINSNIKPFFDNPDGVMSLYALGKHDYHGQKPIVFIRGHAGKWTVNTKYILDHAPNNDKLIEQYEGFWFDDTIHYPFIAEYSYKDNEERGIKTFPKSYLTTKLFADSMTQIFEQTGLQDVDIIGASVGANVAMLASKSNCVDRVSVVSPTMPYTFLADIDYLAKRKSRSLIDLGLYIISKIYLDQDYGFVKDMNNGFRDPEKVKELIDATKIFIDAGNINGISSTVIKNKIIEAFMLISAYPVKKETGLYSDGAVVNDPNYLEKLGVKYELNSDNYHFYCDQAEYILKRAYNNLSRIRK